MGRGRKPKVAKLDAVSDAVDNSTPPTESTYDEHDVGSPVTRAAKRKAGKNLTSVEESEKEEALVETLSSKPSSDLQRLEKKIDFLVQSSVQAFNSKGTKRPFVKEDQALELSYKSQYFESQKMVEALTKENHELSKKLESTLAKVEVYDQMRDAFGHMKDMVLVSNMTKATDALINFTSQLTSSKGTLPAIAAEPNPLLLQGTSGEGTNPAVTAELNASLPKETSGEGTIADVAAKPTASLPQATVGQGTTSSTVSAEPELWRSKRGRKKKEW